MSGSSRAPVVFLVDVDNTLLDNDLVTADLRRHLDVAVGPEGRARYWSLFEELRAELGYADYLGALQRHRLEFRRDLRLLTGLGRAVDGVLFYLHKERELGDVKRRYPADHYVLVDDKPRVLTAVKRAWGARVTTVFPRQGHYAHDPEAVATNPAADVTVERIGDLLDHDLGGVRYVGGREEAR